MCSHYHSITSQNTLKANFNIDGNLEGAKSDLWPCYMGAFIRNQRADDTSTVSNKEILLGSFGLIPHWAEDTKIARKTYNARSETVAEKPSYRDSWRLARKCIIPAAAIFEPDWRSGKAIAAKISRADGKPMGIAGLWSAWKTPQGEILHSYTMLTINADNHPLMRLFHKPNEEKRMVTILHEDQYTDWLNVDMKDSTDFFRAYPAELLTTNIPEQL